MNEPVDLNSLLEGVLASSLNAFSIFTAIRKTKNYSALKTFAGFLDFRDEKQKEQVFLLYAEAIADGNLDELEKRISVLHRPSRGQIAYTCGKAGIDYNLIP